ncbi:hypothetical protein BTO05_00260 [Winogradskyella sp. PC-19]|uniref:DUF3857 domain-containing protein n=1 Tax=unclassified Winogradskyella TaxID=2615021 RepID=UPI000B3C18DC|nr:MULTISPECIES: DUF3857 domain-containing protein [unclassified Winogradskyella]ARV08146.1 hypothetical protein BTO05_00260 [Winogradskyella sp. PC-19]
MKKYIFLLIILFSLSTNAQVFEIGMNVTKQELETNTYEKDPAAEALIIYDYGNAFFNKDTWRLNIKTNQKIKILNKEGLKHGKVEIPLYIGKDSRENLKDVSVQVHNLENGKPVITNMSQDAIYTEKNDTYEVARLVFPNVKVGSIITYSYTKTTNFINKFVPWSFQHDIPTLYSELNASIPGNYDYNIKLVGSIPLKVNTNNIDYNCLEAGRGAYANCAVYRYVMTDIPAYRKEKYTTTKANYLSRIEYELSVVKQFNGSVDKITKSWEDVDGELKADSDFGRQINKKKLVKELLPPPITSIKDTKEKAKAIYQYVLDNYIWDSKSGRYDASIKRLLEEKGGNAFEINLLLQNLLHAEGLESYAMLVSTRDNGLATKVYPVLTDFDYTIVKLVIKDETYYLDATNPYLSFGELPFYCLNQYGRVNDTEYGSYWEDIAPGQYSTIQIGAKYKLSENNQLKGDVNISVTGYNSHAKKKLYHENSSVYLERLKSSYTNSTIEKHEVLSKNKNDNKFSEVLEVLHEEEFVGDKIYFNPFIYKFYEENPFKLEQRTYPIDFGYKQLFNYAIEVELGDKLKVVELPKPINFALPNKGGLVTFSTSANEEKLSVFVRIKLDKPIYDASYYEALKAFMGQIIDLQNNSVVVLEKK